MPLSIGFIGGGNMSTAIARAILKNDICPASQIWVSGPHLNNLQHWKDLGINVTIKNGEVLFNCEIVFLGVKPGMLDIAILDCVNSLPQCLPKKCILFASMLAGINISQLHKALQILHSSLDYKVIRILPNTPMTIGAGSCLYTPDEFVSQEQCMLIEKILSSGGIVDKVPESLMEPLGALTGCGPAFIYIVIEALADGAVKQGAPRVMALRHAAQMVAGSGNMVLQTGKHPGLLKDEVCSPGGCTICGVTALEDGKLRATLIHAIEAAALRTKELGKK